ncbi:hypothetical protein LbFV_ORF38 [Leptopilina boulardi filamentous virus]|uniref:Uncharacterized protein n=1 Tax=Leptopilina boulardi filamentous virus TaxID=552509 RepID=A0A1S5YD78_9VIRU|nr:hypothetical protein LbFV_ORF38 [Leptopilina boulardi filamentous virus]AQQ79958.1 hypothetical protein LbFV_ORF38 [Leptopilina boulardi filamentous virus]
MKPSNNSEIPLMRASSSLLMTDFSTLFFLPRLVFKSPPPPSDVLLLLPQLIISLELLCKFKNSSEIYNNI